MSKKLIISAGTVLILAGIYAGATFYTGNQIQKQLPEMVANANAYLQTKNIPYTLVTSDVQPGFFSSQALLTLKSDSLPELTFDVITKNGPLPGFSQFGMVAFEATLKEDSALKEIFNNSPSPILIAADGRVSFAGDLNMGIAISPLGKSFGEYGLELSSENLTIAFDYQNDHTVTWQANTPKLSINQIIANKQSSFVVDGLTLAGENKPNTTGLNDVTHSIQLDKAELINGNEPRFSGQMSNLSATTHLTSQESLASATYKLDAKAIKFGDIQFSEWNLLAGISSMPVASLAEQNQFAAYFMPMILAQAADLNDETVLSANPKLDISSLKFSNEKGALTGLSKLDFQVIPPKAEDAKKTDTFAQNVPLSSAVVDLKADKPFLTQFLGEFNQMNSGVDKAQAAQNADGLLASILEMSQLYGGILSSNETQVTFNFTIEDGKAQLNQAPLTDDRIKQLLGVAFAPSPFKPKNKGAVNDIPVFE